MGRTLKPKDEAKIIHKRLKACSYDVKTFLDKFTPDKSNFKEYSKFIDDINLYNRFYGYIMRIELQ